MKDFAMFTAEGNQLVARIAKAADQMKEFEGTERVWDWALWELEKLAAADGFEEATDTAVREALYDYII